MANMANPPNESDREADEEPGGPPTEVSKPIGDAIPTPVEPGLDQPPPADEADDAKADPLGETDPPPGVPPPGPSDFA
jgi:hypothetical protein